MDSIQQEGASADCDDGFFGCFKDCCTRAIQFCNSREKRCQDCSVRQDFCGKNQTYVPWECDLYCYKQQLQLEQTCQSEWIFWTGWIVAAVLAAAILVYWLYKGCKSSTCFHRKSDLNSSNSSLLSGSSDEVDNNTETQERENADDTELKQSDPQESGYVLTFPEPRLAGVPPTSPEHDIPVLAVC